MSDSLALPVLTCSSILYRLITNSYINKKTGQILLKAFLLRDASDRFPEIETTLSLLIKDSCTLEEAWNGVGVLTGVVKIVSLHRGRILDLNLIEDIQKLGVTLTVEFEEDDPKRNFACISGLPHKTVNEDAAIRMADLLFRQARPISPQ